VTSISFTAPPTVARFMKSEAFFRLIAGPIGSGKTTGCVFELLRRAIEQEKAPDGLRHTRFAIVRQTLKQLKDTVLKDIIQWLEGLVNYKVSDNTIYVSFGDVRSEWLLIPLDDPEDQRRLLSMQLTGAWLSECIEMSVDIVPPLLGRCGRYPNAAQGGASWFGAIADTNMPTEGDAWHALMEVNTPPNWQVFRQPGGFDDNAENLNWLLQTPTTLKLPIDHPDRIAQGRMYYIQNSQNTNPDWVQRYVHAQYGNDPSGSAVFKETFRRGFHTVKLTETDVSSGRKYAVEPVYGRPLVVLQDFGRNPCSLICQVDHRGRGLVLQELVAEDIGLQLHIQTALKPALLQERFLGYSAYVIGDPAGRAKSTSFEETSFDLLRSEGLKAFPAPTNQIDKRLRAVDSMLLQQRDGGPALLIDEDQCPKLVQALQGRYRYAKRRNGQLSPLPEKLHPWSDLADDLQYFCLVIQGGMHDYVANRLSLRPEVTAVEGMARRRVSAAGWT
jgi:hypothetical protein